ncbi:hypothetical protein CVT24_009955 [Panaeolus cyanescens]|uniref:EF-hand domain-containing protein n=1 Tax=Panaeolus cyanescens TaxID=181874 RepID=A0A409VXF9_9AGAR|nr:hypothetical protein CVT24_009955 [Panaeolus cyanescens]
MAASLLDEEGDITPQFERCLAHIFAKFCSPAVERPVDGKVFLTPPANACLTGTGLDEWAIATNGEPLAQESKDELEFLDVNDDGHLTFKGFLQLYQLQSENDEEETWKDLQKHGFDRTLNFA